MTESHCDRRESLVQEVMRMKDRARTRRCAVVSYSRIHTSTALGGSILFTENCGHGLPALAETSIQWLGTSKIALIPVRGMSGMVPGMVPNEIQSK